MLRAAGILLVGALAAPAAAFAKPIDQPSAAPRPLHVLPFQLYDGRIYVEASGPGFSGRTFLVDSGAQRTHVTAELAREQGARSR